MANPNSILILTLTLTRGLILDNAELFSPGVTAESLRAKRDRKSAISLQRGHFDPTFQMQETHQSFLHGLLGQ